MGLEIVSLVVAVSSAVFAAFSVFRASKKWREQGGLTMTIKLDGRREIVFENFSGSTQDWREIKKQVLKEIG